MKKWTEEELNIGIELIKKGKDYDFIANKLNRSKKSVLLKLNRVGYNLTQYKNIKITIKCENPRCKKEFTFNKSEKRKYCSKSCSTHVNNFNRNNYENHINFRCSEKENRICKNEECKTKFETTVNSKKNYCSRKCAIISYKSDTHKRTTCGNCENELNVNQKKYCSQKCFREHRWKKDKNDILNGNNTSIRQIKRYLIETRGEKCEECSWGKVNEYTGNIPIELEHIDGDFRNNKLENLKLLCPNCHSLTSTYKGANKGNGRYNRMKRYYENKSY